MRGLPRKVFEQTLNAVSLSRLVEIMQLWVLEKYLSFYHFSAQTILENETAVSSQIV